MPTKPRSTYNEYHELDRENWISKNLVLVIFEQRCLSKKSIMFSKNIGNQRQREPIKNKPFIQLMSATMKIISDSNYGTELSLPGEIIVFCHWLQRSTLYSENTCCVTLPNRIFDARYVVAQDLLYFLPTGVRHRLFILSSHKIVQSQKLFTAKSLWR